ncbi:hypothetical protein TNCV_117401 [Trichonephila clavipes]|nr:hypothetical protein TNCV_117401 [Trichonephila clavipes]
MVATLTTDFIVAYEIQAPPISASFYVISVSPTHALRARAEKESDPVTDETDDNVENCESSKCLSNADMFSLLDTGMERSEQQSECCPTQLLLLKRTRTYSEKNEGVQWYSEK